QALDEKPWKLRLETRPVRDFVQRMRSALAAGPELVDERAQRQAASLELDGRREHRCRLSIPPEVREVTCYRGAIRQRSGCRRVFEQRRLGPVHVSKSSGARLHEGVW